MRDDTRIPQRLWDLYMIVHVGVEVSLRLFEINDQ